MSMDELIINDIGRDAILENLLKQFTYENKKEKYGYPILNGMGIEEEMLCIYKVKNGDEIILASDGYPQLGRSLEESEAKLQRIINELSALGQETVQPRLTYDAEKKIYHTTDLALFRLDQNGEVTRETCPHQVVLLDADGTELVRYNLYDYLQRFADQIDVTKQEATIPLAIQFHQLGVEIVLPGWNIEDVNPDWG